MPWLHEPCHPASACSEEAMAQLALAVVTLTVRDLEGGPSRERASAREAVQAGSGLAMWLALLDLTADQEQRVLALLSELAH